jgi:Tropinone reductase 1
MAVQQLTQVVTDEWGYLDILVNNVGTNIRKPTTSYTNDEYDTIINTNFTFGIFAISGNVSIAKIQQGCIVNVTSVAGLTSLRSGSIYGMTKLRLTN